jgi:hypothetical protein
MPDELRSVFPLFLELAGARGYAQGVPTVIPPSEIAAWLSLRGIRPNSRMLWYLRQIDSAWLRSLRAAPQM